MSLRHRLVAAVLAIGVVLIAAGVVVASLIRGALINQVDSQLERATQPLGIFVGAIEPGPPIGIRPGTNPDDRFTELYVAVASARVSASLVRPWDRNHLPI